MVRFPQRDSASERIVVTGPPQVVDGIVDRIRSKISQQENRRPKASFSEFLADVTQDNKTDWAAGRVSRDARAARNTPAKIEDAQARHRARSAERGFQRADTRYAETEYGRTTPVLGNAAEVAKRHMEQELGREEAPFDDPRMIQRRPTVPIGRLSFGKVFSPAPELGIVDSDGAGLQEVNRSSSDVRVMAEAEEHVEPGRRATKSSRRRNRKKKAAVGRRGSGDVGP